MNKSQLVDEIAGSTTQPPGAVAEVVDAFIRTVRGSVASGEKVVLSGFGTFYRKPRARRVARDISAERSLVVPATNVPAFRAGKPFKEEVARPRRRRATAGRRPRRTR
jgi:DNA-binding protein HU-beta